MAPAKPEPSFLDRTSFISASFIYDTSNEDIRLSQIVENVLGLHSRILLSPAKRISWFRIMRSTPRLDVTVTSMLAGYNQSVWLISDAHGKFRYFHGPEFFGSLGLLS